MQQILEEYKQYLQSVIDVLPLPNGGLTANDNFAQLSNTIASFNEMAKAKAQEYQSDKRLTGDKAQLKTEMTHIQREYQQKLTQVFRNKQ